MGLEEVTGGYKRLKEVREVTGGYRGGYSESKGLHQGTRGYRGLQKFT